MYTTVKLVRIENDRPATEEENRDFLHEFQLGVLLALKSEGALTENQYRTAEKALRKHRREGEGTP